MVLTRVLPLIWQKNLPGALLKTGKDAGSTTKDAAKGAEGLIRGILGR